MTALQSEVSTMAPQVAFFEHRRVVLNVDNNTIKQKMAALLQGQRFKDGNYAPLHCSNTVLSEISLGSSRSGDISTFVVVVVGWILSAHNEALQKEVQRLRQLYQHQQQHQMQQQQQQPQHLQSVWDLHNFLLTKQNQQIHTTKFSNFVFLANCIKRKCISLSSYIHELSRKVS